MAALELLTGKETVTPSRKKADSDSVLEVGAKDAVSPGATIARHAQKFIKSALGNSAAVPPLDIKSLGAGTVAGIATEKATQSALNAMRGGRKSSNPYAQSLEKLGATMVGGVTSGAIHGRTPAAAIAGAAGGAALDIADNVVQGAKLVPQFVELQRNNDYLQNMQLRTGAAQQLKKADYNQKVQASIKSNMPERTSALNFMPTRKTSTPTKVRVPHNLPAVSHSKNKLPIA